MAVSSLLDDDRSDSQDACLMSSYEGQGQPYATSRWSYSGWRIPPWMFATAPRGSPDITGRSYRYPDTQDDQYTSMWTKRAPFRAWRGGVSAGALLRELLYLTDRHKRYFLTCLSYEPIWNAKAIQRCLQKTKRLQKFREFSETEAWPAKRQSLRSRSRYVNRWRDSANSRFYGR